MQEVRLSSKFRIQTAKAIIAIATFAISYLIILTSTIALTVACSGLGIAMIAAAPSILTITLGLGLIGLGVIVLVFLIKFLFVKSSKPDSQLLEIKSENQPELFQFVHDVANQASTSKPKKIYLSAEVNASVFYESNFLSLFLPTRKSLHIGLGLVNSTTKLELKAILAHEFGHFSQKTMVLGSYAYFVNSAIYNMLFENDAYTQTVNRMQAEGGFLSFVVSIAMGIIELIQWCLKHLYRLVNISYLGLSREMEFHADKVAASITGKTPLTNSLIRLIFADFTMNSLLLFYDGMVAENTMSGNLLEEQQSVSNFYVKKNGFNTKYGLAQVTLRELNKYNKSLLTFKDQWASHPSTQERIDSLSNFNCHSIEDDGQPANQLFSNLNVLQKKVTDQLFKGIQYPEKPKSISLEVFENKFQNQFIENSFPEAYNGYYDDKNPAKLDYNIQNRAIPSTTLRDIFSDEKVDLVYTTIAIENDLQALEQITDKRTGIRTFDYDGVRYFRSQAKDLISSVQLDYKRNLKQIEDNDTSIYLYFLGKESGLKQEPNLQDLYLKFHSYEDRFKTKFEIHADICDCLQFINEETPIEQIKENLVALEAKESKFKDCINELLELDFFESLISSPIKDSFNDYLRSKSKYFGERAYFNDNLSKLYEALNNFESVLGKGYFKQKKMLLEYQISLANINNE